MTAFVHSDLSQLQRDRKITRKDSCWIVGSGPSLDDIDVTKIGDRFTFALNASIVFFRDVKKHPRTFWFYRDRRIINDVYDRLDGWKRVNIITHLRGFLALRDRGLYRKTSGIAYVYSRDAYIHQRTVVEDALQAIDYIGFGTVYMVGVDHAVVNNQPYAKALSWKECHFYDPSKHEHEASGVKVLDAFVDAMKALKPRLGNLRIVCCSPYYQDGVFERMSFDDAIVESGR